MEDDTVGKPLATDPDALKYTIATQLFQDQIGIHLSCLQTCNKSDCLYNRHFIGHFI